MQKAANRRGNPGEKGITLVEQMLAALFIGFLILVWVNSIRITTKGTIQSKNNLRAQNLALSKLEDIKNLAELSSESSTWDYLTQNATVSAYGTSQVAHIEDRDFTWKVSTYFATLPPAASPGATPTTVSASAPNVWLLAEVSWNDVTGPKRLTMTGYATNTRR